MPRKITSINIDDLIKKYTSGISEYELSKIFGVDRGTIKSRLIENGIQRRNCRDALINRFSKMTLDEKKQLTKKANEKIRNSKRPVEELTKKAKSLQKTKSRQGKGEIEFCKELKKMGLNPIHQFAINKYNIDIAIFPVAVEIHITTTLPHKKAFVRDKIEYLTNHGWSIVFIHVYSAAEITNFYAFSPPKFFQ